MGAIATRFSLLRVATDNAQIAYYLINHTYRDKFRTFCYGMLGQTGQTIPISICHNFGADQDVLNLQLVPIRFIEYKRMLRRCMTPNPNSKTKYLSELVDGAPLTRRETHRINYDSFMYMDQLTNNKILLGEAKNIYSHKEKKSTFQPSSAHKQYKKPGTPVSIGHGAASKKQYSQSKQVEEINDCFSIMKSTKLFQMQSLKHKLFNKADEKQNVPVSGHSEGNQENNQIECMIKKKKKIREFIQIYLNNMCLSEFRKYMEPTMDRQKVKLINPNLLNIHKAMSNKINKHNIEKIIDQFLMSENANQQKKVPINISINDIDFPDEERLKELLMHRIFIKNKDFEYLVTPGHSKQIYAQMHNKNQDKPREKGKTQGCQNLNEFNFNEFKEGEVPHIEKPKKTKQKSGDKKIEIKKKQLLLAIESGSIYDFLFLIIRWPCLLQYKDHLGNNLLHIAGKQNKFEIYSLLIKKLGVQALQQKNNCGKTPIQISMLYGSFETQKINEEYQYCL